MPWAVPVPVHSFHEDDNPGGGESGHGGDGEPPLLFAIISQESSGINELSESPQMTQCGQLTALGSPGSNSSLWRDFKG